MLHKEIPFLRIVLPLSLGVISGLYIMPPQYTGVVAAAIIAAGFALSRLLNNRFINIAFGIVLTLAFFTTGLLLYSTFKRNITQLKPEPSLFECTLSDYPEEKGSTFRIIAEMNRQITGTGLLPLKGSLILYLRKNKEDISFLPGDRIIVECKPAEIANRGNPYEFDYKFYMENRGVKYYSFIEPQDIYLHITDNKKKLIHMSLMLREKIISIYRERGVSEERLGLASAITLGQKKMLDPSQKLSFINAGVMHIMAVSGLHAMILSIFILKMLFFLKGKFNPVRVIIAVSFIWLFAFITGLSPSVVRAALMFSFLQAGNLMKRRVNPVNSVLASAFVLILIRPPVIFDAGFLLSYSAVIFIIIFYNDFYSLLMFKNRLADWIWQSAGVTIVAQAGTLPLTIMLFNRFPVYFILTNIIIVPVSSLIIIAGCLVPLTYPVPFLSGFFASCLNFITGMTEYLTLRASSLPFSTFDNIGLTIPECVILTGVVFLSMLMLLKKDTLPLFYPLLALFIFVLSGTIKEIANRKTNEVIVYNTVGPSAAGIRTGDIMNLFTETDTIQPEVMRHCSTLGLKSSIKGSDRNSYFLKTGNSRIGILNLDRKGFTAVIIQESGAGKGNDTKEIQIITRKSGRMNVLPGRLITDHSYRVHNIMTSGAFRMELNR